MREGGEGAQTTSSGLVHQLQSPTFSIGVSKMLRVLSGATSTVTRRKAIAEASKSVCSSTRSQSNGMPPSEDESGGLLS